MKLSDFKKLIKEAIEEEAEQIAEVQSIPVDEVGKFFIVEKPDQNSEMEDVVYELSLPEFALQIKGGLEVKNILGVYKQKSDARRAGTEALKAYQDSIKEMKDAMEAFRTAKSDIADKKKTAAELIKKLKQ
jgi:hypothetical protein